MFDAAVFIVKLIAGLACPLDAPASPLMCIGRVAVNRTKVLDQLGDLIHVKAGGGF
jgi:hypothetical protein